MTKKKKIFLTTILLLTVALATFLIPTIWLKPWSIDHFYGRVFLNFALRHPMTLSHLRILEPMGLDFYSDDLDDISLAFQNRELDWLESELAVLRSYDREALDEAGQLSFDILDFFLDDLVRDRRFQVHDYPLNQLYGLQSGLPDFMINTHQIGDRGDAVAYIERLEKFSTYFEQVIAGVEHRRDLGIVPPRFVLEKVLTEMRGFIDHEPAANPLGEHFAKELEKLEGIDDSERQQLTDRALEVIDQTVYPTYRQLIATVEGLEKIATDDDGAWKLPDGEAFYASRLRHYTTTELSADEIHRLGLEQVAVIEAEMRQILTSEGYDPTALGATMESLLQDPRFRHADSDAGREEILEGFRAIITEIEGGVDQLFDLRPATGVRVERVPEFLQATAPGAYYDAPPFDGSKPGTFWANLRNVDEHPRFAMRTLAFHEAIPGHHFQIALAQEMEDVPFFRRIVSFTAYDEGWALYAEKLAAEHGFQEDPYDRLGYLQAQLLRAVRLVVDTGIHQFRWTREEAIDYMATHTGIARSDVVAEIERYIVDPGQACAYMVGQLKILELRERARRQLGDRFDLRRFHNVVLSHGAVPMILLEQLVDRWIASAAPTA